MDAFLSDGMIRGQAEPLRNWERLRLDAAVSEHAASRTVAVTSANSAVGKALLAQIASRETLRAVAMVRPEAALDRLPRSQRITSRVVIGYERCPTV